VVSRRAARDPASRVRCPEGRPRPKRACQLLSSKRFAPYLSQDDNGRPYLDRDKVRRAEHLYGNFVLATNDANLSVADIALGYKGIWIIESCFRRMKNPGMEVQPMFHWVLQRITTSSSASWR
jgi:transposase